MKQDWAYKKASQAAAGDPLQLKYRIYKLLHAERARAVRKCWKQKVNLTGRGWTFDEVKIYQQACDDCATAIKGKQPCLITR